ncbi:MAG TPA: hypothetical protein VF458_00895 [Ktedonobacteraceae bacterium]
MSQQNHSDEELRGYEGTRGYETSYTPTLGELGVNYDRHYTQIPAQKIATNYSLDGKSGPSAGQRLALAIVSMVVMIGSIISLSDMNGYAGFMQIAAHLTGIIVVALATVAINLIFAWRR